MGIRDRRYRTLLVTLVVGVILLSSCGSSEPSQSADETATTTASSVTETTEQPTTAAPTTDAPTTDAPTTLASTTSVAPEPAIEVTEGAVHIRWDALVGDPFFAPAGEGADPFFHVHTQPEVDGFFLSFEMYTTGYGAAWTGETGLVEISCDNPATSTGICVYFDADGPGPEPVKGDDFQTTGSLTITQLDAGGYEFEVHELLFSDGTTFQPFIVSSQ